MKMFNSVLRLRRDNDYNYKKIENTFIPASGEICLIDTAKMGVVAVCGDGKTVFKDLNYLNQLVKRGYYIDNLFYKDQNKSEPLKELINVIYIDLLTNKLYYFDGEQYNNVGGSNIGTATSTNPGIMKLYDTLGSNIDGTMTQRAITNEFDMINDELDDKVEITLNVDEELLIFTKE